MNKKWTRNDSFLFLFFIHVLSIKHSSVNSNTWGKLTEGPISAGKFWLNGPPYWDTWILGRPASLMEWKDRNRTPCCLLSWCKTRCQRRHCTWKKFSDLSYCRLLGGWPLDTRTPVVASGLTRPPLPPPVCSNDCRVPGVSFGKFLW